MVKKYYWRVKCNDHGSHRFRWLESATAPTVCPDNDTHTDINTTTDRPKIIKTYDSEIVTTNEGELTETGRFNIPASAAFDVDSGVNSVTSWSRRWPYPMSALDLEFVCEESWRGDTMKMYIGQHTTAGLLQSDTSVPTAHAVQNYTAGDTVTYSGSTYTCHTTTVSSELPTDTGYWRLGYRLHVPATVLGAINEGSDVRLTDGTNTDDLGEVVSVDPGNAHIYVENLNTIANAYSASSPVTYIQLTYCMVGDSQGGFEFAGPWKHEFGGNKIGGSLIPANTEVKIEYTNVDGAAGKRFVGNVSILRGTHDGSTS